MDRYQFIEDIHNAFDFIGKDILSYEKDDFLTYEILFKQIEDYAYQRQLKNTVIALHVVRGYLFDSTGLVEYVNDGIAPGIHFNHCLNVCNILINLHTALPYDKEDILLASALSHILVEKIILHGNPRDAFESLMLEPEVYRIVELNYFEGHETKQMISQKYQKIQENWMALLVKLCDRGNILEQLYEINIYDSLDYIRETKTYYLPMCIYGKENYHHLYRVFSILTEKIRCLVDITDILTDKHLKRMNALNDEILMMKEENARIRLIIKQLEDAKNEK